MTPPARHVWLEVSNAVEREFCRGGAPAVCVSSSGRRGDERCVPGVRHLAQDRLQDLRSLQGAWSRGPDDTWAKQAGFDVVDVVTVAKQITFPSMLDYIRFQLTATPMAALLNEKVEAERERLIGSIAADAASRLDPSMLTGGGLTFPQESFVVTTSVR